MEQLLELIPQLAPYMTVISGIVGVVALLYFRIKAYKNRHKDYSDIPSNLETVGLSKFDTIKSDVMRYIMDAELAGAGVSGVFKRMLVVSQVKTLCLTKGISCTDTEVTELIEELIAFSKAVNCTTTNPVESVSTTSNVTTIDDVMDEERIRHY